MSRALEPTDDRVRLWASRGGLAAVVVVGVQLLWRSVLLGRGYFTQDDFLVMAGTRSGDWSSVLSGDYAGGFSPGGTAVVWLSTNLAPLSWPLAAVTVLLLQTAATVLMWVVLTRLLGERWLRLPALVLFAFSPLTLWSTQWWVLGLEYWSATLLLLVAVWALLIALRTGDRRATAVVVLAVAVALLFDSRAVLYPVVLVGVALVAGEGPSVRKRAAALARDAAWVWAGLALVLGGYGVLRWQAAPVDLVVGDELGDVVTGYLRHGLAEVFGGPWLVNLPAHAYLVPTSWVVALNGALLLGLAGATLQRGGAAARAAWGSLVVFVGASVGVLALEGRGDLVGSLGLVHRFAADLAPVVILCLAGALREVTLPPVTALGRVAAPARVEAVLAAVAVVVLTASCAVSTARLAGNLFHTDDRAYVDAVRAGLRADPQVVLLDSGVPEGVISPWYAERARLSSVVGYAPENPVFDLPSHAMRIAREDGTLAPVVLEGAVVAAPSADADCPYPVRSAGTEVPMAAQVPPGRWVVRLGYYTSADGYAVVDIAGTRQRFAVRSGLNAVQLVVEGGFDRFRMTLEQSGATLCLTDASAGIPRAGTP